jgi:PAS domain S-box-containing protein
MNKLVRPTPLDREIKLDPSKVIMSKTNPKGIIEYANDYFMDICGYEEYELMGQPHNVIRHPDMPKVIFKLMWERLHKGENIYALVKNLAKDGRFYWVLTSFETKYNDEGEIISHYARRKAAPGNAVFQIEKLYKTLKAIEERQNPETAEKYFYGLLEEKGIDYDTFILKLLETSESNLNNYFGVQNDKAVIKKNKSGLLHRMFG